MPKHRGPILEHRILTPASLSDLFMENATNSQKFACCSAVRLLQPPQALVDLGLELGNKRFSGHPAAGGRGQYF
jgi:hypothetical protein